jgi:hypothetical protein
MKSPTPMRIMLRRELLLRQGGEGGEGYGGEYEARRRAELRPTRVEVAALVGGVLDRHQDRASPLAAHGEALQEAQHHEQDGGQNTDRLEGRQKPDQERRPSHDQERDDEHGLPADPVTEVAENHAPHRPGEEAHGERGEGRERAGERRELREK